MMGRLLPSWRRTVRPSGTQIPSSACRLKLLRLLLKSRVSRTTLKRDEIGRIVIALQLFALA
jgi:hypothetical protein